MSIQGFLKNWKTTVAGIGAALVFISTEIDFNQYRVESWRELFMTAVIVLGLLFARDADKSTEETRGK
jgi:hypothetical protein